MSAPDLDAVFAERDALTLMMQELQKAEDQEQFDQIMALIQAQAAKLEETAGAFAAEQEASVVAAEVAGQEAGLSGGKVEVLLTPDQRQRVYEQTGVDMPSVLLQDPVGARTQQMPETPPEEIELHAVEAAEEFNRMVAAQAAAMQALQEALATLEDVDDARLEELIEKAKQDPEFLAGLLAKK